MASELEQSFADICAKHNVSCLGVNFHPAHADPWAVYAHGDAVLGSSSSDTLAAALSGALAELAARRGTHVTLADEPLPVEA